jgi:hypothetical protein
VTTVHFGAGPVPTQPPSGGRNTLSDKVEKCFLCYGRRTYQPVVYTDKRTGHGFCQKCTEIPGFWRVWGPQAKGPKVGAVEFVPSEQGAPRD